MLKKIKVRPGTQGERKRITEERTKKLKFALQGRGMDLYDLAEALHCTMKTLRRKITAESWTLREYVIMQHILTETHDDLMRTLLTDYEPTDVKGYRLLRPYEEVQAEQMEIAEWNDAEAERRMEEAGEIAMPDRLQAEITDEKLDDMYCGLTTPKEPTAEEEEEDIERRRQEWEKEMLRSTTM